MRIRVPTALAIVTLAALSSIAGPVFATSIGVHPRELADVILIFRPHDDHLFSVVDEVVRGDILKIERGLAPRLIISPAGTLGPSWKAGVPIRLYLLAFTDRSAHYPIGVEPAPVPKPPAITVSASQGPDPIHATATGQAWFGMDAVLTLRDPEFNVRVDVYVGITPPTGESLSLVLGVDPRPSQLVASAAPRPLLVDVLPTQPASFRAFYGLTAVDPRGWYTLYGLVVPTGADPLDPHRWLSTSFFPVLVSP